MTPQDIARTYSAKLEVQDSGCWYWTGYLSRDGYGQYGADLVHRMVYEALVGAIPLGAQLDHLCHNADLTCAGGSTCEHRRCANPAHLEPVNAATNMARGVRARRTHCPQGHEYTPENTHLAANRRVCRACDTKAGRVARRESRVR